MINLGVLAIDLCQHAGQLPPTCKLPLLTSLGWELANLCVQLVCSVDQLISVFWSAFASLLVNLVDKLKAGRMACLCEHAGWLCLLVSYQREASHQAVANHSLK